MLQGHHRAVRAYADAGNSVVVDDLMLGAAVYADWLEALRGVPVTWVRIDCPSAVAEQREVERGQRAGLARGTHEAVHDGVRYDLTVDTSRRTPAEAAQVILGGR